MKKIYLLVAALVVASSLSAQIMYDGEIGYTSVVQKTDDQVGIGYSMILDNMRLRRQQMVTITPQLRTQGGVIVNEFRPVIVAGPKRYKALKRSIELGHTTFQNQPQAIVKRKNRKAQSVSLGGAVPYNVSMRSNSLVMHEVVSGCASCGKTVNDAVLMSPVMPPAFSPEYAVAMMAPPAEEVKLRRESYSAHLNYLVGQYKLLKDYKNNGRVLAELDTLVRRIQSDPNLAVRKFTVTGYASPEGNFNSNMVLSQNRARTFLSYLKSQYKWDIADISSKGMGEDWNGLYKVVEEQTFPAKDEVLAIIRDNPDINMRKQKLHALNGGATYRLLLKDYYPGLRRNDFDMEFVVRPFTLEEARELIKTKPQMLSLDEMYRVANSYTCQCEEYQQAFATAVRLYPQDPLANVNYAAVLIDKNDYDGAIELLQKFSTPEALNNLGVAYILKGDIAVGKNYLEKASAAGNEGAEHNLYQLGRWQADQ